MEQKLAKFNAKLNTAIEWLIAILLFIATCFILAQVLFRYVLHSPLDWTEQTSRYLFIWMMMMGMPVMFYRKSAMAFDLILNSIHGLKKHVLQLFIKLLILVFSAYFGYQSMVLASKVIGRYSAGVEVPLTFMYSSMVISNVIVVLVMLEQIIDSSRKLAVGEHDTLAESKKQEE